MITKQDKDTIEPYLKDASNYHGSADIVYIPEDEKELIDIVDECFSKKIPISVSGAGTGLGGARVPLGGAVISLEKLNKIINVDTQKNIAVVQPGVLLYELETELEKYGLFYPPNPTEKNSSLGGNIGTNASGSRTFKYGATRNYIEGMKLILSNNNLVYLKRGENISDTKSISFNNIEGEKITVPKPAYKMPSIKHTAGYYSADNMDAIDLFIGSEGTLGLAYQLFINITPIPEKVLGLIFFFDNYNNLLDFVDIARTKSRFNNQKDYHSINDISARLIEFYNKESLTLLSQKYPQIPKNALGAVWIEQEYSEENESEILEKWYELVEKYSSLSDDTWVALNDKEHNNFREFRHALPLAVNEILTRNGMRKFGTDIAVPDEFSHEIFFFLSEEISKSGLSSAVWGHIGNSHYHANVMANGTDELDRAKTFFDNSRTKAIAMGGTISGEHGIGKIKKKYLKQMYGENGINDMINIKKILDPYRLFGIGTLFDY